MSLSAKTLVVAAVVLGATACTASKPISYSRPAQATTVASSPAAPASPLPTTRQTPVPGASGQLTGVQLQSVLVPQSAFPGGFAVSSASVVTSGGSLTSAIGAGTSAPGNPAKQTIVYALMKRQAAEALLG